MIKYDSLGCVCEIKPFSDCIFNSLVQGGVIPCGQVYEFSSSVINLTPFVLFNRLRGKYSIVDELYFAPLGNSILTLALDF